MVFRADIEGLRGLAVLLVLLFHLGFQFFSGGYVGVDVFFVISGFLITGLIRKKIEENRFTLVDFYYSRMKRLFPALFVTIFITLLCAIILMQPDDLILFAKSSAAAVFSVSNIEFFLEAGYWDVASDYKPLLHTWSLGVEEQFYLFWPLLLTILLTKLKSTQLRWLFFFLTIVSYIFSWWMLSVDPSAAFYLTPFRVFQFSCGALAAYLSTGANQNFLHSKKRVSEAAAILGLVLIVGSAVLYDKSTVFPGYNAVPPSLGCFLLLIFGITINNNNVGLLIINSPLLWLGRISYALYLTHWPIISLYRYVTGVHLVLIEKFALFSLALLSATALHYFVERRFYRKSGDINERVTPIVQNKLYFSISSLVLGVLLASTSFLVIAKQGSVFISSDILISPLDIKKAGIARFKNYRDACRVENYSDKERCNLLANNQVLIIGNSHEVDGYNFIVGGYGARDDINIIVFGATNECTNLHLDGTLKRFASSDTGCDQRLVSLQSNEFISKINYVVYSANKPFSGNKDVYLKLLSDIKGINKSIKLISLGGFINTKIHCSRIINETGSSSNCKRQENVSYFPSPGQEGDLYSDFLGISDFYVDKTAILCKGGRLNDCITETPDGVPMFYDGHHLSRDYAEMLGALYAKTNPKLFGNP